MAASYETGMQIEGQRNYAGVRACLSCRQMKMKCEGSENPPCVKCKKVGRECLPQVSNRNKSDGRDGTSTSFATTQFNSKPPAGPAAPPVPPIPIYSGPSPNASNGTYQQLPPPPANSYRSLPDPKPRASARSSYTGISSAIPSIYSTPPVDTVLGPAFDVPFSRGSDSANSRKRRRHNPHTLSDEALTPSTNCRYDEQNILSRADMKDMIELFVQRHLPFTTLRPKDFEDPVYLIENELAMVYCICYVTARFLPGGTEIREKLLTEVVKLPKGVLAKQPGVNQAEDLSTLTSLFILYIYADLTPASRLSNKSARPELQFWYLKSVIEVYATRLGLHRLAQDLWVELRTNPQGILETSLYQKYMCWLFLFSSAHYASIMSATPPTIRIDSSIRAAPGLLQEIQATGAQVQPNNLNIFGQIDLNLIWERASAKHTHLGEWWSHPDSLDAIDDNHTELVLQETDREIDSFYDKWSAYIKNTNSGSHLDFTARFTRFCISSYAIKFLRSSPSGFTPLQKSQVCHCVASANHVLEYALSRSPIQKDKLRYVDDTACVMDAFCCLFIISACQTFSSIVPNIFDVLDNVTETAQLMVDLQVGFDESQIVFVQGSYIMKRAEALREFLERERDRSGERQLAYTPPQSHGEALPDETETATALERQDHMFSEEGFFGMEPIWDFSLTFPGV